MYKKISSILFLTGIYTLFSKTAYALTDEEKKATMIRFSDPVNQTSEVITYVGIIIFALSCLILILAFIINGKRLNSSIKNGNDSETAKQLTNMFKMVIQVAIVVAFSGILAIIIGLLGIF